MEINIHSRSFFSQLVAMNFVMPHMGNKYANILNFSVLEVTRSGGSGMTTGFGWWPLAASCLVCLPHMPN